MYGNYKGGPQRAAARAHFHGLTVGAPVRAEIGLGHNWPLGRNTTTTAYAPARVSRAQVLTPLERIDRMARYLLQRDVTTHVRHGSSWQPTPRQRRRLDHKARHAAAPFGSKDLERRAAPIRELIEAGHVIHPDSPAAPRGFTMIDRRGEHRS